MIETEGPIVGLGGTEPVNEKGQRFEPIATTIWDLPPVNNNPPEVIPTKSSQPETGG